MHHNQILHILLIIQIILKYTGCWTIVEKEHCNNNNRLKEKYNPSDIMILKFQDTTELSTEDNAVIQKLYSVPGLTWGEYLYSCNGYAHIRIRIWN